MLGHRQRTRSIRTGRNDVSQDPAVVIPSDDLSAERDRRTDGEEDRQSIGGQIRAALSRCTLASDLRSVDAEQSDALRDAR